MNLLDFLTRRPDEASVVARHLALPDLAAFRKVSRGARGWAHRAMREKLGAGGVVPCGTNGLTLDLVTMRFAGNADAHDRGSLFWTGIQTVNAEGLVCRLLVRTRDRRYSLCWAVFADACKTQRLFAHTPVATGMRPLVLPRVQPDGRAGILVLSPCGSAHDFIAYDEVAQFVATGLPGSTLHEHDYVPQLHCCRPGSEWDHHVHTSGLYEAAAYVLPLQGVVFSAGQTTLSFVRYDRFRGFHGPVIALPFRHTIPHVPTACTYAYEHTTGTLYVVGGKLDTGRKSAAIYAFPLLGYLKQNTAGRQQFVRVATLRHARAWCHVQFADSGRVMLVWGGKGKMDRHPGALEVLYRHPVATKWAHMRTVVACPDNVVW